MSHGSGGASEGVEINLIPMIDIVIQLITFFLMLVSFDQTNTDERIRLPIADLATPSEDKIEEPLILNVNRLGQSTLLGELCDVDSEEFQEKIRLEAGAALKNMKNFNQEIKFEHGRPILWTTVIIRADKEVDYGKIQRMIKTCMSFGFVKYSLRASPSPESL
jgi:biopolymer transport protein ExbD